MKNKSKNIKMTLKIIRKKMKIPIKKLLNYLKKRQKIWKMRKYLK